MGGGQILNYFTEIFGADHPSIIYHLILSSQPSMIVILTMKESFLGINKNRIVLGIEISLSIEMHTFLLVRKHIE